jgi:hypothetical protein
MRLSGVDPGIIRELSGIYKPFIKAFKELLSNAYDADAQTITVTLADDFSVIEVLDDGVGMTPHEFQHDFARLGGSTAWLRHGKSAGGRPRIGYKGIGFLAVARYCSGLHIETHSLRPHAGRQVVSRRNRKTIPFEEIIGDTIPMELLAGKTRILEVRPLGGRGTAALRPSRDYVADSHGVRFVSARALSCATYDFQYRVDCSQLLLEASLDFDYLLGLERQADLRLLEDFCTVSLKRASPHQGSYTRVQLRKLKDFVVRDLSAPPVKGKARNIVFKSGKDQFLWRLARTAPIRSEVPADVACPPIQQLAGREAAADLPDVIVKWRSDDPLLLKRPIYLSAGQSTPMEEAVVPVEINEQGLRVFGYLLARSEVIYPAEFRGLSIRVRNVAIGDASFLGWEHILSGPRKAAMSQITGELFVVQGLAATDAINPGRESFYEENAHYRILRRTLFGSGESIAGLVGKAIRSILDRIHVRSQVTEKLAEARERRKTLVDISSAVNYYGRGPETAARGLSAFFQQPLRANGLASVREVSLRPGHKLAGFELEEKSGIGGGVQIDFKRRKVRIDFDDDAWNTTVYLNGHYYHVLFKQGKPDQPICEFDNERRRIYVNWGHPVKLHMADAAFLKSAILLRLAYHAVPGDANAMMELALNLLAFRAE